jgi:hypothetical protein
MAMGFQKHTKAIKSTQNIASIKEIRSGPFGEEKACEKQRCLSENVEYNH